MSKDKPSRRQEEIVNAYFSFLNSHIESVISGASNDFLPLSEIAHQLHISHQHLTDTIKQANGQHPCYYYDLKIIEAAKEMLKASDKTVTEVAYTLTYDPSNFSKFFKKIVGVSPGTWQRENT
ncbi:helix-turn-helix domain-containing protein [Polluticaenibacter yanchengensis]|uniref:AraC family transcriptional regulator n=1 Tax=Polluticaenibacter yanchengensis TaxID=3014562 RepID=A0ABT4UJM5_9BACT|nr:AraC family transcriptional regulator [Chitinophagaceae bacterium LY-5]